MTKYEIVNLLARKHGLRSYLEICTPTTGWTYSRIDETQLSKRNRLMYRCPDDFDDGLDCAFRTSAGSSHEVVQSIARAQGGIPGYDMVFVDPFHTYEASMTDLLGAYCLVRPGGVLVVHDCCPEDPDIVSGEYTAGNWCGVTYQAFVDFVTARRHLRYYTVDCDYGCGVIFKPDAGSGAEDIQQLEWFVSSRDERRRFQYFSANRKDLIRLIGVDRFLEIEGPRVGARWWRRMLALLRRPRSDRADQA